MLGAFNSSSDKTVLGMVRNTAAATAGVEGVDAESGDVGQFEREVDFQVLLVDFPLVVVHHRSYHIADLFRAHFGKVDAPHIAVNPNHRGYARTQVKVGCFVFSAEGE